MSPRADAAREVTRDLRHAELPLPEHDDDAAKGDRGTVLVVGGSASTAGAVLLAGLAALRVGAGKLRIATVERAVGPLMTAVPEALVAGLPESRSGDVAAGAAARVVELAADADAVLLGTGALDPDGPSALLDRITRAIAEGDSPARLVIDVAALVPAGQHPEWIRRVGPQVRAVPNPSEIALLVPDDEVDPSDAPAAATSAADRLGCVVASRGPATWVAEPGGQLFVERSGSLGLATSGSGDVAAGIAVGLLGRGASPTTAAVWTAFLHGRAGERLSQRIGPLGFLARELLDELPCILADAE